MFCCLIKNKCTRLAKWMSGWMNVARVRCEDAIWKTVCGLASMSPPLVEHFTLILFCLSTYFNLNRVCAVCEQAIGSIRRRQCRRVLEHFAFCRRSHMHIYSVHSYSPYSSSLLWIRRSRQTGTSRRQRTLVAPPAPPLALSLTLHSLAASTLLSFSRYFPHVRT